MLTGNDITRTVLTGHMDYYEKREKGIGEHKRNPNVILAKEGNELNMRRTFQEIMRDEDYEELIKEFEVVKFRLSKYIYQRKFIDDVERFILEQSNYVEKE